MFEARIGEYPVYIGMDVHKSFSQAAIVNEMGEVLEELRVENTRQDLEDFALKYSGSKAVMEATGNYRYIYDLLEDYLDLKNDSLDAKMLAHLLRANLIAESYVPCKVLKELRDLTRTRKNLRADETRVKNRVRSILARNGIRGIKPFTKEGREELEDMDISDTDRKLLEINYSLLDKLDEEIKGISKVIEEKAKQDEDAQLLMTIPGISYYSALLIKSEIGDINRFPNKLKLVSYAGICPSVRQSGNKEVKGHITKQGSRNLRWILIQCANVAIRHDDYFRNFYQRIERKKGHKKAIVATARKMLVCIYYMLTRREPYNPK